MAGYRLTDEQRIALDATILASVRRGHGVVDDVVEDVRTTLLRRRETWATNVARLFDFRRYVKSGLKRLASKGQISRPKHSRGAAWSAVSS